MFDCDVHQSPHPLPSPFLLFFLLHLGYGFNPTDVGGLTGSGLKAFKLGIQPVGIHYVFEDKTTYFNANERVMELLTKVIGCSVVPVQLVIMMVIVYHSFLISGDGSVEQRLLNSILRNYDTDARGVRNINNTVRVEIQLLLLRIQGLDERSQVLTSTGLIICDWYDHRLRWNPEEYEGLEDIVIKPERIWLPELALMNGAEELAPDFRKVRILLNHNGNVHWEPGGVFTTTCDIDIRYFPFDDQSCPIQFGAWAYYSARMNITNSSHEVQTHDFRLNGEWDIHHTRAQWKENVIPCCPNTRYPYVEFTLFLRRRHAFYVMNIILPCTLLSILVMIVFCLPPDAGEKISLGISVLLAFTVFLLMVAENIPRTSLHIPVIVIYLTCTMGLGTVSVCLTVLVLNLHHRDAECPVPRWATVLVLQYLATLLRVRARKPHTAAAAGRRRRFQSPEGRAQNGGIRQVVRNAGLLRPIRLPNGHPNRYDVGQRLCDVIDSSRGEQKKREATEGSAGTMMTGADLANDWKEVAHVLDRLFFWFVLLSMTASAMIILLVPYYKEDLNAP